MTSPPLSPRVDLRAAARSEALGIAGAGLLAVVLSPIVFAIGAFLLIGLILGPILLVGGLVAIPYGLWKAATPESHRAIRALGATDAERAAVLDEVEVALATSCLERVRLASGAVLGLTPRWLVAYGRELVITRREDVLWGYGKTTTHTRYGMTTGRSNEVCLVTRRTGEHAFAARDQQETGAVLALVRRASPRAFIGYDDRVAALGGARLAAEVDRVPFQAADAGAPLVASAPSGWSPTPAPTAPSSGSSLPLWALLVAAIALAATGLLAAIAFGWIATHPDEPDDVRFGSLCSIVSVLVCFAPGAAGAALATWRILARAARER